MDSSAGIGISWLGIVLIVFVVYMIVKALANSRSRPFVIGLLLLGAVAFVFVGLVSVRQVRMVESQQARVAEEYQRAITISTPPQPPGYPSSTIPVPPPPGYSAARSAESTRPRRSKASASATKVAKADNSSKAVKSDAAEKPTKPATPPKDDSDDDARPRPKWVNAEPRKQGDVWLMTRHTEPNSTELECDREVPRALQSAVAEYTDLLLGNGQARNMRLADIDVGKLERDRWVEKRTIERRRRGQKHVHAAPPVRLRQRNGREDH